MRGVKADGLSPIKLHRNGRPLGYQAPNSKTERKQKLPPRQATDVNVGPISYRLTINLTIRKMQFEVSSLDLDSIVPAHRAIDNEVIDQQPLVPGSEVAVGSSEM